MCALASYSEAILITRSRTGDAGGETTRLPVLRLPGISGRRRRIRPTHCCSPGITSDKRSVVVQSDSQNKRENTLPSPARTRDATRF